MQLVLSHIDYTYPTSPEPVLSDVSLTFPQGWSGIVGDNGTGKPTLVTRIVEALLVSHDAAIVQASTSTIWETETCADGFRLVVR